MPDNSTLSFPAHACFRVDTTVVVAQRRLRWDERPQRLRHESVGRVRRFSRHLIFAVRAQVQSSAMRTIPDMAEHPVGGLMERRAFLP